MVTCSHSLYLKLPRIPCTQSGAATAFPTSKQRCRRMKINQRRGIVSQTLKELPTSCDGGYKSSDRKVDGEAAASIRGLETRYLSRNCNRTSSINILYVDVDLFNAICVCVFNTGTVKFLIFLIQI